MKTKNIYLFSFIFFLSCQQKQQKCDIIQPDKELQIYNDVLIELTEKYFYLRYLGKEGEEIKSLSFNDKIDSVQIGKRRIYAHNKLWGNSVDRKSVV